LCNWNDVKLMNTCNIPSNMYIDIEADSIEG